MAVIDLKNSIRKLRPFLIRNLPYFGTKQQEGEQHFFDRRGAGIIRSQDFTKPNGEVIKIRGIAEAGRGGGYSADSASMAIHRPGSNQAIDPQRAMDAHHGWAYAAVKAISDEIANIEFRLFMIKGDEHEEQFEHEVLDLFEGVNDYQTGPEFRHMLAAHLELTGNAYLLLLNKQGKPVKSYDEKPASIYLLDPGKVKVILDKTTYPFFIKEYKFTVEGREFFYAPEAIAHVKYPDPSNPYQGLGSVAGIAEWIDNDNNQTEFMRQFFHNGATIGLTFETEMSSEEQLHELRDSFNEQHSGVKNAYKAMFLPKGVKKPTNDVQFKELGVPALSEMNRDMILAGFRVSKTILGTAESDTNRATAETADYVFSKRTIKPKMQLIVSYLNEFVVSRFGDDIYLTFIDPVPEDKAFRTEEMKTAVGGKQVITQNEARETFMGLGPVDDESADSISSAAPVTDPNADESEPAADENKSKKAKKSKIVPARLGYRPVHVRKGKTQFSRNRKVRTEASKSLSEKVAEAILGVKMKKVKDMTREEYDQVILVEKSKRTGKYADKIKEKMIEINNAQKEEVMKNFERQFGKSAAKKKIIGNLFDLAKWVNFTINALRPIVTELMADESRQAFNLVETPYVDITNTPTGKTAIDHALSLLAQSYNQDTLNLLEAKLNEGLSQGYGVQQLGELIQDIYAWKNEYAAERVALTESNRITNTAGKLAWQQAGIKEVEWVTSKRDNVCQFCMQQDGEIISVDENFFNKGDEISGADGGVMTADYSDIGGPPLHPNCHCGIRPIVDTTIEASARPGADKEVEEALEEIKALDHEH